MRKEILEIVNNIRGVQGLVQCMQDLDADQLSLIRWRIQKLDESIVDAMDACKKENPFSEDM